MSINIEATKNVKMSLDDFQLPLTPFPELKKNKIKTMHVTVGKEGPVFGSNGGSWEAM